MSELNEDNNLRDILRYEDDSAGQLSREVVTVAMGQVLEMGSVIGKKLKTTAATGTASISNVGDGTVDDVYLGAKAKLGIYTITAKTIVASPEEVVFQVTDPDGGLLPEVVEYDSYEHEQINFTINDGSPAIVETDRWFIEVSEGSGEVTAIDYDGLDGTQDAYGFVTAAIDTTSAAAAAVAIVKDAVIVSDNLVWPDVSPEWSDDQKAAALAQLAAKGIVARDEA